MSSSNSDLHGEFYNTKAGYEDIKFNDNDNNEDYQPGKDDDNSVVLDTPPRLTRMLKELKSNLDGEASDLNEPTYGHMVSAMMVAEHVGVRMMKQYFEIEALKAAPQYGLERTETIW